MLTLRRKVGLTVIAPAVFCLAFALAASGNDPSPAQCEEKNFGEVLLSSGAVKGRKAVKIFEIPKAEYTEEARRAGIQGTVTMKVRFLAGGRIGAIELIEGLPAGLSEEAIKAAKKIRFLPARHDGRMVNVAETVEYHFGDPRNCSTATKR